MDDYDNKDGEENDEDPFEWYYELDDEDKECYWTEFSYNRYSKTLWSSYEPSEWEIFLEYE